MNGLGKFLVGRVLVILPVVIVIFLPLFEKTWLNVVYYLAVAVMMIMALMEVYRQAIKKYPLMSRLGYKGAYGAMAVIILVLVVSSLVLLGDLSLGKWWQLSAVLCPCVSSTAAMFLGRTLGKNGRKFNPAVSERKTWVGTYAGLVSPMIVMVPMMICCFPGDDFNLMVKIGLGVIMGLALGSLSVYADLLASTFKRSLGIKDFGRILLGHGGMTDRIVDWPMCILYLAIILPCAQVSLLFAFAFSLIVIGVMWSMVIRIARTKIPNHE